MNKGDGDMGGWGGLTGSWGVVVTIVTHGLILLDDGPSHPYNTGRGKGEGG